jgi:hypothetical protein
MMARSFVLFVAMSALLAAVGGCHAVTAPRKVPVAAPSSAPASPAQEKPLPAASERPVAPETNPPGDIPDTQVFVEYVSSAGGYAFRAPEGWARKTVGPDVSFVDKLDGVSVSVSTEAAAPSVASATKEQVVALKASGRAVQVKSVKSVHVRSGPAILVDYGSNSEPDPVTGKQVRLDNHEFLFYRQGKLARLRLWAPVGADNVDQWKLMSDSFRWQ